MDLELDSKLLIELVTNNNRFGIFIDSQRRATEDDVERCATNRDN